MVQLAAMPTPAAKPLPDLVAEEATDALLRLRTDFTIRKEVMKRSHVLAALAAVLGKYRITHRHEHRKGPPKAEQTEEQWIAFLETVPAYTGIDIRRELGKCQVWASTAKVQVSRRRFVNWLNKVQVPMNTSGVGQSSRRGTARTDIYSEPEGWRDTLRFIGGKWDREKVDELCRGEWLELPATVRAEILKALQ